MANIMLHHYRKLAMAAMLSLITASAHAQVEPPVAEKKEHVAHPDLSKYKSIMYSSESIGWINEAMKSREQNIPLEILLPTIFPPANATGTANTPADNAPLDQVMKNKAQEEQKAATPIEVAPPALNSEPFYLKSILYISPENWTVWINDKRISNSEELNGLRVVSINSNEVYFLWKGSNISSIFPKWKESLIALDGSKFYSNNKNLVVNGETGDISFILSPNQSFIPASLDIIEGRLPSADDKSEDGTSSSATGGLGEIQKNLTEKIQKNSLIKGHNPADGLVTMQKYMGQLNMLKSILDTSKNKEEPNAE